MGLTAQDRRLLAEIQDGLPLEPAPYAAVARRLGVSEAAVIERLAEMKAAGLIRRFGVVVRHHELGYKANAMVVWDIADEAVRAAGGRLAELPFVTLCYRRPRRPPDWPYNLFTMIHGRDRPAVEALVDEAAAATDLEAVPREILFSRRRFKQRGACYAAPVAERMG
jgi:DNA-binding Lrp family transcriptional regulator